MAFPTLLMNGSGSMFLQIYVQSTNNYFFHSQQICHDSYTITSNLKRTHFPPSKLHFYRSVVTVGRGVRVDNVICLRYQYGLDSTWIIQYITICISSRLLKSDTYLSVFLGKSPTV